MSPEKISIMLVACLAGAFAAIQEAQAGSATVRGVVDCSLPLCEIKDFEIVGQIDSSTADKVKWLIDDAHTKGKTDRITGDAVINSPGGSVTAAMAIGRMLRKDRLGVIVPYWGNCLSACVLIYAGAVSRMSAGKVGIHRPYLEVPQHAVTAEEIKASYQRTLQELRSYLREMNVSDTLADAMLSTPPEAMRLLDDAALESYGFTLFDPVEEEATEVEDAQSWGLNRQEYMRRKSLAAQQCPGRFGVPDQSTPCYLTVMKTGRAPPQIDFSKYGTPAR
jgi:hypothetical protein